MLFRSAPIAAPPVILSCPDMRLGNPGTQGERLLDCFRPCLLHLYIGRLSVVERDDVRCREAGPSARIGRVQSQSPFEVASGSHRIGLPTTIEEVAAVQVLLERLLARRVRALNLFSFFQFGMQRMSDGGSDLVLHV